jgi:hypothetical protein
MKNILAENMRRFGTKNLRETRDTGLMVIGHSQRDNNAIGDLLDGLGLHAEWDARNGHWFFPEKRAAYDELERILDAEFAQHDINASFEGL